MTHSIKIYKVERVEPQGTPHVGGGITSVRMTVLVGGGHGKIETTLKGEAAGVLMAAIDEGARLAIDKLAGAKE